MNKKLYFFVFCCVLQFSTAEVHRARPSGRPREHSAYATPNAVCAGNTESCSPKFIGHSFSELSRLSDKPWIWSLIGSALVGCTGIFPLLIIPLEAGPSLRVGKSADRLKLLLSFAIGALLGDVFFHLLPESWNHVSQDNVHSDNTWIGLWVIIGLLTFLILEKIFSTESEDVDDSNDASEVSEVDPKKEKRDQIQVSGYLNLLANCIDNFTHGLAVAGSFMVSYKVGMVTTLAILLHEIPHEVGDFAILLRAGFDRWKAAKAQLLTASSGMLGAAAALYAESAELAGEKTAWVLPFTSGGFLYIALVTCVPDLLKETKPSESLKQTLTLLAGIFSMYLVTCLFDAH